MVRAMIIVPCEGYMRFNFDQSHVHMLTKTRMNHVHDSQTWNNIWRHAFFLL